MRKSTLALALIGVLFSMNKSHAQGAELGILIGPSFYSGDLSPEEAGLYFQEMDIAGGVFARFNLNRTLALRLGANMAKVSGDDRRRGLSNRDLNFQSNILEAALIGEVNLFHLWDYEGKGVIPYLFGGAAVFRFNPEASFDGDYVELQPLGTEGQGLPGYEEPYRLTQLAIPLGIGVKILLNKNLALGLELGGRKLFTDHLDDVSNAEVNYFDVLEGNGELAARLSNPLLLDPSPDDATYRRGGDFKDWYYIGGLSLSFRLQGEGRGIGSGRGIGCPTF